MSEVRGKIAIVTGANSGMGMAAAEALSNSGMGMAAAEALSDKGATVIMLCRSEERGREAFARLTKDKDRKLDLMICDLGDYTSVRGFVRCVKEKYPRIDILVNNAGFISLDRQETKEGVERQFGINHLGHFLLTTELLDHMPAGARIVNVASGAHKVGKIHFDDINLKHGYNVVRAYSQSKLANVLFTRELAMRLRDRKITVNCCHPGAVATNMGVDRETGFGKMITGMLKPFFLTPAEGARTAIYLATDDEVRHISGGYFYKCRIAKSSKRSKSRRDARKLFELSEEMVRG